MQIYYGSQQVTHILPKGKPIFEVLPFEFSNDVGIEELKLSQEDYIIKQVEKYTGWVLHDLHG